MTDVCCGIDLGTSGVKVSLLDSGGTALATSTRTYPVESPRSGWAETDPEAWAEAVADAIAEVRQAAPSADIVAVGLDGQMHGIVLTRDGRAVRPAVLWPDSRAAEVLDPWRALSDDLRAPLANPIVPGMAGPILTWLLRHEPDSVDQAQAALSPKDWVRGQLVSETPSTDPSDASATLLWDVTRATWHTPLITALGIPSHLLPEVRPSSDAAGRVDAAAERFGLPVGVPVAVGCGDAAATLLAADPDDSEALVIVGTGIQVLVPHITPRATVTPSYHTFVGADGEPYAMVAPQNGGLALGRVVDLLACTWDELYASLDRAVALPDDLLFAPWFSSDRLPRPTDGSQAGWRGLGLDATRPQLLRAALESVAFQARRALESIPRQVQSVRLAGGGTRSSAMQQLLADVLGLPVRRCDSDDVTARGAAMLGWAATTGTVPAGWIGTHPDIEPRPDPALEARYASFTALAESASTPSPRATASHDA